MIEATVEDADDPDDDEHGHVAHGGASRRFPFDRNLVTALVDHWRPETHTFHMPIGEMTVTLQDVSMLTGLALSGDPVGPAVPEANWREDMVQRFQGVLPHAVDLAIPPTAKHGPQLSWLRLFRVWNMFCLLSLNTIHFNLYAITMLFITCAG